MLRLITEWLWPRLTPLSPEDESRQQKWIQDEQEKVRRNYFGYKSYIALEEARRLFDAEQERRRGADSKAGLYLAAITALMPILATILPGLWDEQMSKVLRYSLQGIFFLALLYLMGAGWWALQTLKVTATAQLSAGELVQSFSSGSPEEGLVKKLLCAIIYNFGGTNQKVSCIKMTHEFLIRAFLCFFIFLVLQVAWPAIAWGGGKIFNEILNPLMSCFP